MGWSRDCLQAVGLDSVRRSLEVLEGWGWLHYNLLCLNNDPYRKCGWYMVLYCMYALFYGNPLDEILNFRSQIFREILFYKNPSFWACSVLFTVPRGTLPCPTSKQGLLGLFCIKPFHPSWPISGTTTSMKSSISTLTQWSSSSFHLSWCLLPDCLFCTYHISFYSVMCS